MFFLKPQKIKIYILLGHPDKDTYCGAIADHYEKGAKLAGHEVVRSNIGDLKFDPILHKGYKVIQELEPDLKKVQENFKWADHIVIIYPNWFISLPALLKGLFDRMWLPGFAYHFHPHSLRWHKLLKGKTARVIITMDGYPILERIFMGDYTNEISKGILGFAGISVNVSKIGPLKIYSDVKKKDILEHIKVWGEKAK